MRTLLASLALVAVVAATACKGPEVSSPLTGMQRYLCCNLYYQKTKITDVGWQAGTRLPFGTPVTIDHVWANEVEFRAQGQPPITLVYKYGKGIVPFGTYLDELFVASDPHATLKKVSANRLKAIQDGVVEPGMTRAQVLMSRGIPPAHRTPSLQDAMWTYWQDRWSTLTVYFTEDKVERVGR